MSNLVLNNNIILYAFLIILFVIVLKKCSYEQNENFRLNPSKSFSLLKSNTTGKYCVIDNNNLLICNSDVPGEIMMIEDINGDKVLKASNGKYCSVGMHNTPPVNPDPLGKKKYSKKKRADYDNFHSIVCDRDNIDSWEKYEIVENDNNSITLKPKRKESKNSFCTVQPNGKIVCDAKKNSTMEKLIHYDVVSLQSQQGNKYCGIDKDNLLMCNKTNKNNANNVVIENTSDGYNALKASNGKYCAVGMHGSSPHNIQPGNQREEYKKFHSIYCDRDTIGPWEKYKIVNNGSGSISLMSKRAESNNSYCAVHPDGRIVCDAVENGPWEKLNIV